MIELHQNKPLIIAALLMCAIVFLPFVTNNQSFVSAEEDNAFYEAPSISVKDQLGDPVAQAEITVTSSNSRTSLKITTPVSGMVVLSDTPGTYTYELTSVPLGYTIPSDTKTITQKCGEGLSIQAKAFTVTRNNTAQNGTSVNQNIGFYFAGDEWGIGELKALIRQVILEMLSDGSMTELTNTQIANTDNTDIKPSPSPTATPAPTVAPTPTPIDKDYIWPAGEYHDILEHFGNQESATGEASTYRQNVFINVPAGEKIVAPAAGTVEIASYYGGYGNAVVINIGNNQRVLLGYLSSIAVQAGDTVSQGDVIGYAGSTGNTTRSGLAFGWIDNGAFVDPMQFYQ